MTIEDILMILQDHQTILAFIYFLLPVIAFLITQFYTRPVADRSKMAFSLSTLVFSTAIPGIFSSVLILYSLFFLEINLLQLEIIIYYLPIFSMIATLFILARFTDLSELPGFDRLQGLLILLSLTFIVWFLFLKLRVWVVFGGSVTALLIGGVIIYLAIRRAMGKAFGK